MEEGNTSFDQQYFSSVAPIVIGDHVLAGTGNDMDAPGFLHRSTRKPASASGFFTRFR